MKIRLYCLLLLAGCLLAAGCTREEAVSPGPEGNEAEFRFNLYLPDERIVETRGVPIGEGMIGNLHVLVFDQNGTFLSRTEAIRSGAPGEYTLRLTPTENGEIQLPPEKRKRIVHFIANYHWADFSDLGALGKHENEIVSGLSTAGGTVAYWQRIELPGGIAEGTFPAVVELIRNVAKITVRDLSIDDDTHPYLADTEWTIGKYMSHGTVAPFRTSTLLFEEEAVVESPDGTLQEVADEDFIRASREYYVGEPLYCYERKNSTASQPLYVIIRGRYATDPVGVITYYKIDIVGNNEEILWDITRNYHYQIMIRQITGPGYSSLAQAMSSPASNNLLYSIVLEDYKSVSDGVAALNVETTVKTLVAPDQEFRIGFSYLPDGATEDNTNVDITLEQSSVVSEQVLSSYQVVRDAGKAYILARTSASVPVYTINSARLIVTTVRDGIILRRVIKLRLRAPVLFGNFTVSPNPAPATAGTGVEVSFTVPNTIREQLYPFAVYITAKNLTPDMTPGKDDDLTLDYQIPGRYRYSYIVHHPGDHKIHFKTTAKNFSEVLIAESELFQTVQITISGTP